MTAGQPFFHRGHDWTLGLRTNPATAWVIVLTADLYGKIDISDGSGASA